MVLAVQQQRMADEQAEAEKLERERADEEEVEARMPKHPKDL